MDDALPSNVAASGPLPSLAAPPSSGEHPTPSVSNTVKGPGTDKAAIHPQLTLPEGKTLLPAPAITIEPGTKLLDRYVVDNKMGAGGFGQIYSVRDEHTKKDYALKWQTQSDSRRIKLEMTVLLQLRGKKHIPNIIASGTHRNFGYIIIQALGKNLGDLRRELAGKKFSDGTVYRVFEQMLYALRDVHEIGYLHRDVKPNNMCIGTKDRTRVFLIDFGMARQYTTISGRVRKARETCGFRGTPRYVATTVHNKQEQGPAGDLVSLIYSAVELALGTLPWFRCRDAAEIAKCKESTSVEKLCGNLAKPFVDIALIVWDLEYDDFPDYDMLLKKGRECLPPDFAADSLYDWENQEFDQSVMKPVVGAAPTTPPPPPSASVGVENSRRKKVHCNGALSPHLRQMQTTRGVQRKSMETVPMTARFLPQLISIWPPSVKQATIDAAGGVSKHTMKSACDQTMAFRISTTKSEFRCSPHYGFIPPRGSIILEVTRISVGPSTSEGGGGIPLAERMGAEKQTNNRFHIYHTMVEKIQEGGDPKEILSKCPKRHVINLPIIK